MSYKLQESLLLLKCNFRAWTLCLLQVHLYRHTKIKNIQKVHFIKKIFLRENQCKTLNVMGCDKMDLRLFHFRAAICTQTTK